MDRDFLNKVFDAEGRATDTEIDVHAVGNVFAFYNASADVYQLVTYRSVSSVAEVYRLGYLARYLAFDGTTFAPYYQTFNVSF